MGCEKISAADNGNFSSKDKMARVFSIPTAKTLLSLLCLCGLADAQSCKRLWVLEAPDRIAEFDPNTFVLRSSHQVPAEVFQSPQDLQINAKGQMLFAAATLREPDGLVHESSNPGMWLGWVIGKSSEPHDYQYPCSQRRKCTRFIGHAPLFSLGRRGPPFLV